MNNRDQARRASGRSPNRDLIIYCDRGSSSARTLANVLGCRRWYETSSPGRKTAPVVPAIINWGSSSPPLWIAHPHWPWPNQPSYHLANSTEAVSRAIDKRHCLAALHNHSVAALDFILQGQHDENSPLLRRWLEEDGRVIARTSLTGHSGSGIRVVSSEADLVRAPLYTRYYPKTHEFRVHVWGDRVIDITQKRLRSDLVGTDADRRLVRSLENGWIHSHTLDPFALAARSQIDAAAVQAVAACGLNFGAVDVLARFKSKRDRPLRDLKVCEINTAPGLENSQTIEAYANAIDGWYLSVKRRSVVRPNS